MILAGDIGGTNTRLAIFATGKSGKLAIRERKDFKNAGRDGLAPVVTVPVRAPSHPYGTSTPGVLRPSERL